MLPEDLLAKILLTRQEIESRVRALGEEISRDYAGESLVLVGILKGSFVFLADLMRYISIPVTVDFVQISSYGTSTSSSGMVKVVKDLGESVDNKHVLIVEDIIDTGWTLQLSRIVENLYSKQASTVKVCALLDRRARRRTKIKPDYVGFVIPDQYVFGYGLDFEGLYRNLPDIYALREESAESLEEPERGVPG